MLPRQNRITRAKEFERFFGANFQRSKGKSLGTKAFVFKVMKNDLGKTRFGFIVGTKVDNRASVRNKIKRRLRAIVYSYFPDIIDGLDFIIVAMKPAAALDFAATKTEVEQFFRKVKILKS
jgi:ribonuclease P protein component